MTDRESRIRLLEGGRAKFAYECALEGKEIKDGKTIDGEKYKDDKYKSYIKKLPVMIISNGLGQSIAFIKSKGQKKEEEKKNAYDLIYRQIEKWLKSKECPVNSIYTKVEGKDLVEKVISCNSQDYRALTREVLSFTVWVSRFAEGLIEEKSE